jgi:hypothetical protein
MSAAYRLACQSKYKVAAHIAPSAPPVEAIVVRRTGEGGWEGCGWCCAKTCSDEGEWEGCVVVSYEDMHRREAVSCQDML